MIFRPVLIVCGDYAQQQPFQKLTNRTVNVPSPLNNQSFLASTYQYILNGQHRIGDEEYLAFLNHIRHWIPSEAMLRQLQEGRVLCPDGELHAGRLIQALQSSPECTILTFTKEGANKINRLITSALYDNAERIGYFQLDSNTDMSPIYKGMRVMITPNRDKTRLFPIVLA